ncbi:aldehyde dehydrogenase family protein [Sphingomonas sp. MMS24-JH45]
MAELISFEPATGAELWRGSTSDVELEVATARDGFPIWASKALSCLPDRDAAPLRQRRAPARRGAGRYDRAQTASRCGKRAPRWRRWSRRSTSPSPPMPSGRRSRRMDAPMNSRIALRHKPHGVLAVLGPAQFPRASAQRPHRAGADRGQCGGLQAIREDARDRGDAGRLLPRRGRAGGDGAAGDRRPDRGRALAAHPDIDGLLFHRLGAHRPGPEPRLRRDAEKILALEMGGNNPIVVWDTPDVHTAAVLVIQSAFTSAGQRCTAARRLIVEERLAQPLLDEILRLSGRSIVGAPHDDPQPFMGPVIDNDTADGLTESFLALMMKGGIAAAPHGSARSRTPLPDAGHHRRHQRDRAARHRAVGAAAGDPHRRFRRRDRARQRHPLRPVGLAGEPDAVLDRFWLMCVPASSTGTSRPTAHRRRCPSAASAGRAITGPAPITPPIIVPIRSPATRRTRRAC